MASEDMMMHGYGLSPYETFRISEKSGRRPSGAAIAGLVLGSVGTAAAIGAWIAAPIISNNRSRGIEALANAQFNANQSQLNLLTNLLLSERNERVAQGVTISQSVQDTLSGSQAAALTAQQASELSAVNTAMQQTFTDAITGKSSLNPTPVTIYSAPSPCGCPGCGCNG